MKGEREREGRDDGERNSFRNNKQHPNNNCMCVQQLCDIVSDILIEEGNVQNVAAPVTVCGDIHGQVCVVVWEVGCCSFVFFGPHHLHTTC